MPDDTHPHRLGPYRFESLLGRGGMGVVHVAWDERLERRVALKRVPADDDAPDSADPRRRARLRREARLAAQLAHPAVVRIFDLLEEDDGDWIVMELVEGRSLAELLRDGPLDVDTALTYGRQIAEGLAAAHAIGIVHRDLKTENVVIEDGGGVKILDFGLAKRVAGETDADATTIVDDSSLSVTGQVMGTGRAMSPEQARGLEVGPRSDLFSLGVLLYEALGGVSPFLGETFNDTLVRVATHQPTSLDELVAAVPHELTDLVERLLRKAPEMRPSSAREVAGELTRLEEERRLGTNPPDPGASTATWIDSVTAIGTEAGTAKRRVWPKGPMAILGAAVLAAGLAFILRPSAPEIRDGAEITAGDLPNDPLALYEEGMRAVLRIDRPESTERAIEIFQRLLERDGSSAPAHAGLARAYWQKAEEQSAGGDPVFLEQAAAAAREAVRLDPYLADARVALGLVELSRGRPEAARRELEEALVLEPSNAGAHFALGRLAQRGNRPEDAETRYRQATALADVPRYHDALGSLFFRRGRFAAAEEEFRASLELAPDNVYALRNLGGIYFAQDRLDEAAARFQEALKIHPDASIYSNLGTIFFLRGLYPKAAGAFEDALRTDGASHKHIFWLNLADAYRQMPGKEEDARLHYRRAIELLGEELEVADGNRACTAAEPSPWRVAGPAESRAKI